MKRTWIFCMGFCLSVALQAQPQITFVASFGADTPGCGGRSTPCASFQAAHDHTAAGGLVRAIDAGDFGGIQISKAITIDGGNVASITGTTATTFEVGSILVASHSGLVTIRNLSIQTPPSPGVNGVGIDNGEVLLENVSIAGANFGVFSAGSVTLDHVTVTGAGAIGVWINTGTATMRDSVFRSNPYGVQVTGNFTRGPSTATISRCAFLSNGTGLYVSSVPGGPAGTVMLSGSMISGNSGGITQVNGGIVMSFRDNVLGNNGTDGVPALGMSLK